MKNRMKKFSAIGLIAVATLSPLSSTSALAWGNRGWWPFAAGAVVGGAVVSALTPRPVYYAQPVVVAPPRPVVYVPAPVAVVPARPVYYGYGHGPYGPPPPPPGYYRY